MMMRAAGIPARIVTGYLGGEWNPVGGYFIVRQSDAHAWTEVWLDETGWTRIDPTTVIAPERLQRGVFDLLAESLPAASTFMHNSAWLNRLEHLWDGANQWWQERVVEFNLRAQLELLRNLGIDSPSWQHLGWAFAGGLVLWIAWVTPDASTRRRAHEAGSDRARVASCDAQARARRAGARARRRSDGICARVGAHRPDLAARIDALAQLYTRLRFGRDASNHDIAAFEREVRNLAL